MSKITYNTKTVAKKKQKKKQKKKKHCFEIHCSATFSIATTWSEVWKSISIAK